MYLVLWRKAEVINILLLLSLIIYLPGLILVCWLTKISIYIRWGVDCRILCRFSRFFRCFVLRELGLFFSSVLWRFGISFCSSSM